jgi:DNA-binding NtrC family response regulator
MKYMGDALNHAAIDQSPSALMVGIHNEDRTLVHDICQKAGYRLLEVSNRRRAIACMVRNHIRVVITVKDGADWDWKGLLGDLRMFTPAPELIVASRNADDRLWAEALNVGAYDVLAQPLVRDEAERVIAAALRPRVEAPKTRSARA